MGREQREWAKRVRKELVKQLGGKCKECGTKHDLEFDHLAPRDWVPREKDPSWRMSIIRREIRKGLIQLLCSSCNSRKGHPELVEEPF